MMKYFMTDNQVIHEEEKLQDGVWVRMISPTQEECEEIADVLNVEMCIRDRCCTHCLPCL